MDETETLRESLASAKQLLAAQEARLRQQDLVLSGIEAIAADVEPATAIAQAFEVLRTALAFDQALVLEPSEDGFVCIAATTNACLGRVWLADAFFRRVAAGRGAVVPDVSRVPDWSAAACVAQPVGALFTPVSTAAASPGLLVLCADRHGAYGAADLALVSRLAVLISQTLAAGRQRRLEEAVRDAEVEREAAVRANEIKTRFFANMSHEIRTPLNGVVAVAELLADTELSPRQAEMARVILDSGRMLDRLLNDVLDFSKIESGRLELEVAPFNPARDLQAVFDLFAVKADTKGLALEIETDAAADAWFEGDSLRVRQVAANLLSNAVKFTDAGGVRVKVGVDPGAPAVIRLQVRDSGCGFDQESAERLFDRFEQEDGSITRKFGGSGLGLAIARTLARMMGGDIRCEATSGQGATFEFWFEAYPVEREALIEQDEAAPALALAPSMRVLVAEDNPNNQRIVAMVLETIGISAVFTANGEEALRAFQAERFDLVLMDLQMPVMDGLTAMRAIRAFERGSTLTPSPIVALSANAMTHQVEEALIAGADAHVAKPISPAALLHVIAELQANPSTVHRAVA